MKRDFKTVLFSPSLNFFANNFVKRWNLNLVQVTKNTNVNIFKDSEEPLIVVGCHFFKFGASVKFKKILESHKGPQVFFMGGAGDTKAQNIEYVKNRNKRIPTYMLTQDDTSMKILEDAGMLHRPLYIPLKPYTAYKPIKLGNKIWFHVGFKDLPRVRKRYGYDTVVKSIIEEFGRDRVGFIPLRMPSRGPKFLHQEYKKSFVYVKPNSNHGSTTMWELGRMGRRTICPGHSELNNVVQCKPGIVDGKNIDNLIELIKKEESRIGTIQPEVSEITRSYHLENDSWMQLDFWKDFNNCKK
jgi:hypothetical protein